MSEYLRGYHPEYEIREKVLETGISVIEMVNGFSDELEAIVFGGSYAKGVLVQGDDLDADFLYAHLNPEHCNVYQMVANAAFSEIGADLHIRMHVDRSGHTITLAKAQPWAPAVAENQFSQDVLRRLFRKNVHSPFIATSQDTVNFWGL